MLGLEPTKVLLLPYDPQWAVEFEKEQTLIKRAIGEHILSITHVGSTSIPGLCAKPIIDILIGLQSFQDGFKCVTILEDLGYTFRGEHGIPGRHFFRKGLPRTHHIHMFEKDSQNWRDHFLFCDYLRTHEKRRDEYSKLKISLAENFKNDREHYTDGKADFIQQTIQLAKSALCKTY